MQFSGMFDPFREVRRGRCPHRPKGTNEFAGEFRISGAFRRDDVGIVPYANLGNFQTPVGRAPLSALWQYEFADGFHVSVDFPQADRAAPTEYMHVPGYFYAS